jgi:membrane protease subunit HflK
MLGPLLKRLGITQSLHDPRWGHNPKDEAKAQEGRRPGEGGPPDLDQLWRDFNARLNRIFGQRGGGDGGKFRPDARGVGVTALIVLGIAALIWLASGAFIVKEGQKAVVTTFGKQSYLAGPGFNWRWPYPFQAHEVVNLADRTAEIGYRANARGKDPLEALMLTDDENIVDIQFSVKYKVKSPVDWVLRNRDPEETVRQLAESAIREVVGRSKMDYVLYQGRDRIALEVHTMVQQLADRYHLGAQVIGVAMQAVQPPDQVQSAFEEVAKAAEDRKRLRLEGEAYAKDVIPRAREQANRVKQDAEAYRSMVVENATGNAARFDQVVAEYTKAPVVTRDRMYMDTMQQVFTSASKVMIDAKANGNTLYLPLDKLMAQGGASDVAAGSKSGPVQAPAPAPQQVPPQQQQQQPQPQPQPQQPQAAPPPDVPQSLESVRNRDARSRDATRERERETR